MSDDIFYKFHPDQNKSGLIPPVDPYDAIAKRIAESVAQPTRPGPAASEPPVLSKAERIEQARAEAKAFLSDPEMDHDHLVFTLSLRWDITRQEAAAIIAEARQQTEPQ